MHFTGVKEVGRWFVLLAVVFLLTGAGPQKKAWTYLFYVAGDETEIDRYSRLPIRKLEQVGSDSDRWIVVQSDFFHDGQGAGKVDEPSRRYLIEKHPGPIDVNDYATLKIESPALWESAGEQNSASAESLSAFISWGKEQYPAEHYALFVLGHGWSWRGVPEDDNPGFKIPTPPTGIELQMWLQSVREFGTAIRQNFSVEPLDLLVMDACSMHVLEFLYELRQGVNYVIATQDEMPFYSFDYVRSLGKQRAPRTAPDLGNALIKELLESFSRSGSQARLEGDYSALTLGLLDLRALDPFWREWTALAGELPASNFHKIFSGKHRDAFLDFEANVDLYEFLETLRVKSNSLAIRDRAVRMKQILWGNSPVGLSEETPFEFNPKDADRLLLRMQGDELLPVQEAREKAEQFFDLLNPHLAGGEKEWKVVDTRGVREIQLRLQLRNSGDATLKINPWIAGATWAELTYGEHSQRKTLSAPYFLTALPGQTAFRVVGHTPGASRSRGLSVYFAEEAENKEPQNHHQTKQGNWLVGNDYYRSLGFDLAFRWSELIFSR